ncbi:MAG: hypothetical protein J6036_02180 [Clostridia bacterium]|nr:hypothetical protein [Clostridia bacterium]
MKDFTKILSDKKIIIFLAVCAIGILLVILGNVFAGSNSDNISKSETLPVDEYVSGLEERLRETVSFIDGAGSTKVFITLDSSYETVYANNSSINENADSIKSAKTTEKRLAYTQGLSGEESAVVVKQICPKICGVLIVCEGGSDKYVQNEIVNSVSTAFNIAKNKIYVTGGRI